MFSDVLEVIKGIKGKDDWSVGSIFADIRTYPKKFNSISSAPISRKLNRATYVLPRLSFSRKQDFCWDKAIPFWVINRLNTQKKIKINK